MIEIGKYSISAPTALAPMAGVTDLPFRKICRQHGAGLVVSEMVTSDSTLWNSRKSSFRLDFSGEPSPRSVQIAGSEPAQMAEAARMNVELGAEIIDINMGCPAKKVCKKAAGSSLLRDEKLVADILDAVVGAVDVPVTLKIRTGWCPDSRNATSIARIAQSAGIQALAVHGRTRACKFNGNAEYNTMAEVVNAVSIPVIANGDITTPQRARWVLDHTGAAMVMIGRGAQGNPWLFHQINHFLATGQLLPPPDDETVRQQVLEHLTALHDFYGEFLGLRIARKHTGWYLSSRVEAELLRQFNRLESPQQQLDFVGQKNLFQLTKERAA